MVFARNEVGSIVDLHHALKAAVEVDAFHSRNVLRSNRPVDTRAK